MNKTWPWETETERGSSKRDQMGGQSMKRTISRMGWSAVSEQQRRIVIL